MTAAVFKRFPNHIEPIEKLLEQDTTFQEICADYEEVCGLMDDYYRTKSVPSEKRDQARELIRDLEGEIIRALKESE